ncbi:MAG: right-handed parallel beta-helix repeat-containing protein, partial [Planctomycetota bacterium JB042]
MSRDTFALTLVALLAARAPAADHHVPSGGSIQAAIDAAVDGDRVLVDPGTFIEHIDLKGKAIQVLGLGGPSATILSGSGSLGPVVTCHTGETPSTVLRGFTIQDGWHQPLSQDDGYGAGISAWVGSPFGGTTTSPTIEDCVIRNNQSILAPGGGVAGDPVLRRCVLVDNFSSDQDGAAVFGAPTMVHCLVASNYCFDGDGGGVAVSGGTATLSDVTFVENRTRYGYGGGLAVKTGAHATITRCRFVRNQADFLGIGSVRGGAVYVAAGATAALDRCTVTENGGKVPACPGSCPEETGGVYGPAVLTSCIVRDNVASQVWNVAAVTYSDVEGGHPGIGNFDADPSFVDAAFDLHLRPGSPCIDAGDPNT